MRVYGPPPTRFGVTDSRRVEQPSAAVAYCTDGRARLKRASGKMAMEESDGNMQSYNWADVEVAEV